MVLYNLRDLAKSTFTHINCGMTWKGEKEILNHINSCCSPAPSDEIDDVYTVPNLPNVVLTFGWALFSNGLWHLEVCNLFYFTVARIPMGVIKNLLICISLVQC